MTQSTPQVTVDCYVRAPSLAEPVDEVITRVRAYEQQGTIDGLAVEAWPNEVCLSGETEGGSVHEQYERFERWAGERGVSLEPAFTRRERTTLVSDETETVLVLPVACLAVSVDGELVRLAPCSVNGETYTISDALADIETMPGNPPPELSDFPPRPVTAATPATEASPPDDE